MTTSRITGRRDLILGLGRGGLAFAVLGVAGCSSSETPAPAASPQTGQPTVPVSSTLAWERVNLGFVSAYVLVRNGAAAIVDTGVGGSVGAIETVLQGTGLGWNAVTDVILTHHHPDHAGSISDVLDRATEATGHIGPADLEQVVSPRTLSPAPDGAEVFGLQIVGTPGHTAGHISVFDTETGVLIVGDAVTNNAGLSGSNPQYTDDAAAAAESIAKLAALPVQTVLFGHGEPLLDGAAAALTTLAQG